MMGFLPVLCVLAWLSSPKAWAATSRTRSLSSFTQVQVNLPFNVKIAPASSYSLKLEASPQVLDAVTSSVSNSVLYLGTNRDFRTQQPIYATVFLPAGSLQRVSVQSPVNTVAVDSGFSVQSFSADVSGTGTLYVKYLTAKKTAVTSTGTCSTFLNGNLGDVYLQGSGTSKFYLQGQANSLGLDLSGVSNAESAITSGNLRITGNVNFPGRVSYVAGTCSLDGEGNNSSNDDDYDDDDDMDGAGNGAGYAGAVGGALGSVGGALPGGALPGGALPGGAFGRRLSQAGGLSGILGSSCRKVSSANIPTPDLRFTCGIDVKGSTSSGSNNNQGSGSNGSSGNAASGSGTGTSGGTGTNGNTGNTAVGGSGGSGGSNNGNSATPGTGNTGMNSGRGGIASGSSGSPGTPGTATSGDATSKLRGSAGRHLKQSGGNTVVGGAGGNGGNNGGGNGQDGESVSGGGGSGNTVIGGAGGNGGNNGGRDASGTSGNTTPNSGNGGVVTGNSGNGGNGGNASGGNGGNGSNGSSGNTGNGAGNGGSSGNGLTINTIDCQSSAGRNIF